NESTSGTSTAAVMSRSARFRFADVAGAAGTLGKDDIAIRLLGDGRVLRGPRLHAPEASLPLLVGGDGLVQIGPVKVRPKGWRKVELRVGGAPEEKVGNALLAPGANEEIDGAHGHRW